MPDTIAVIILALIAFLMIVAILCYLQNKDQKITNDLLEDDIKQSEKALLTLQQEFTKYQVDTERKISELEKSLEIKSKNVDRSIEKIKKELPIDIRKVIGHIEFAKPLDKK